MVLEHEGCDVRVLDVVDGFDVSDPSAWEDVGAVDLACLNTGVVTGERLVGRVSDEQYRRIVGVNLDGVFFGVRRLACDTQRLDRRTASLGGLTGMDNDPLYSTTKHAIVGFVRSTARSSPSAGSPEIPVVNSRHRRHAAARQEGRGASRCGLSLLRPDEVAEAVLVAARDERVGQAWVVQPGASH